MSFPFQNGYNEYLRTFQTENQVFGQYFEFGQDLDKGVKIE